jgi:hypothetical protein
MVPESTDPGLQLQNALENLDVFVADRVLLRWTVTSVGRLSTKTKFESHHDDGLRGAVVSPSEEKGIEVYLQRESDSRLPIEVADQLATVCGIDQHASLIYFVLIHSDHPTISDLLDRRGIPKIKSKIDSVDQGKPDGDDDPKLNTAPESDIRGDIDDPGSNAALEWDTESDIESVRSSVKTQPNDPQKNTEKKSGDWEARSEHQVSSGVVETPDITENPKDKEREETDSPGGCHISKDTGGVMNMNDPPSRAREHDQPKAPPAKVDASRQLYPPPPAEPSLPRPGYMWLVDAPETPPVVLHTTMDTVETVSGNKVATNSGSFLMFERPRIVGSPSVVFVSSPQELPAENFSDGARGGKTLPARARISQSGACIVSVAVNPDIGSDLDTVFIGELFVRPLSKRD